MGGGDAHHCLALAVTVTKEDYLPFFVSLSYSETAIHLELNISSDGNTDSISMVSRAYVVWTGDG